MVTKQDILDYIKENFGEDASKHYPYCKFPEEECTCRHLKNADYDTELITGGYIDSFSMVEVLVFIEATFGIKIPNKEATPESFNSVNKMYELVEKYK